MRLPEEDPRSQEPDACGLLQRTMYGTLDAAEQWAAHYTKVLLAAGCTQGEASACHFYHAPRDLWIMVHGDDFISIGQSEDQAWLRDVLAKEYELKQAIAAPNSACRSVTVLGRVITVDDEGWQVEADPRHVEACVAELNLHAAKGVATPVATLHEAGLSAQQLKKIRLELLDPASVETIPEEDALLDDSEHKTFMSIAARLNYLSLDRADIQFGVKELSLIHI